MCRLLGYLGEPISLHELLWKPEHSLETQSYAPQRQQHGLINADGWGVGWYSPGRDDPARYRTCRPMWSDTSFLGMASHICSGLVVAEVRSATPPAPAEESGVAPFADGRILFAHNGLIEGFHTGVGTKLRRRLSTERESQLVGAADSEVLFALTLDALDNGAGLVDAIDSVVRQVLEASDARLNLLMSDGERLVAVRCGDTLFVRTTPDAHFVASEPLDRDHGWSEVPDESIMIISDAGIDRKGLTP